MLGPEALQHSRPSIRSLISSRLEVCVVPPFLQRAHRGVIIVTKTYPDGFLLVRRPEGCISEARRLYHKVMKYVALLRGVNIGGRNKVDMKRLVQAMEAAGFEGVSTYINSGNLFFSLPDPATPKTPQIIEGLIGSEFDVATEVLLKGEGEIAQIASSIPRHWSHDSQTRVDIMFLWPKYDDPISACENILAVPDVDTVEFIGGALLWRVDKDKLGKSGQMKLPGTDIYRHMTIRNCNTVRKIAERLGVGS